MGAWLISGIADEDTVDKAFEDAEYVEDIKKILFDSFTKGITETCIVNADKDEAIRIAKRLYGFKEFEIECFGEGD